MSNFIMTETYWAVRLANGEIRNEGCDPYYSPRSARHEVDRLARNAAVGGGWYKEVTPAEVVKCEVTTTVERTEWEVVEDAPKYRA